MANNFSIRDRDRAHVSKTRMDYLGENFEWIESWIRNNNFSLSLSLGFHTYMRGQDGRRLWQRNGQVERIVPLRLALSLREKRSSAR